MAGALSLVAVSACTPRDKGHAAYATNCGICHHGGEGMPGETPPLRGRLDRIAATELGRRYLQHVLLNGVSGPIHAGGEPYSGEMPSFRRLDDPTIAAILTWLCSRGDSTVAPVFTANDIALARRETLSPGMVWDERAHLDRVTPLP
nr:cytochrome c [Ameyamaea chiangmaiensis]